MNLDGNLASRFEYKGWLINVEITGTGETFSGYADLRFNGDRKCRVALATARSDHPTARRALDAKARQFIDEWTARSQTGRTDFRDL